jgi:uncharacterized protein YgfB (UPF0149 family)
LTQVRAVDFHKAEIGVQNEKEFEELKSSIGRALDPDKVEGFLKGLRSGGVRVRDWDGLIAKGVLERADQVLAKSGSTSRGLYQALTLSDQAQMREFYLSKVEDLAPEMRTRFKELYQYY